MNLFTCQRAVDRAEERERRAPTPTNSCNKTTPAKPQDDDDWDNSDILN